MDIDKIRVGIEIKRIRKENGYSLKEFGIQIGEILNTDRVKEGIISRWENGISLPNNERLKAIADIGGKSVESILYGGVDVNKIYDESYFDTHQTDFQKLDSILLGISIQAEKDYIALENSDEDPLVLGDLLNNISYVDITTQYRRELIRRQPLEYSFYVFDHIIYILKPVNELSDDDYKIDLNYFTGIQVIHEDPITLEKNIILDEDLTSSKQVVDIIRQHWGDIIYLYFEGREWGWKDNINNKQTLKEVFLTTKYGFKNEQILDYRYPIEY